MSRTLLALLLAFVPGLALAGPPSAGSVHTFIDPMFGDTVVCDHIEEVRAIAAAEIPELKFQEYFAIPNARNEPTCAAMVATGIVVDVQPIGRIMRDGKYFYAYSVEGDAHGITFYALFLEHEDIVNA